MNSKPNWTTPSKWILAGEHAVLRGGEALVFPLFDRNMKWELSIDVKNKIPFQVRFQGLKNHEIEMVFWSALEKACAMVNLNRDRLFGELKLESNIPLGMGLGASASLSVGLAQILKVFKSLLDDQQLQDSQLIQYAHQIENFFHGESSGVDVAVVFHQKPLIYAKSKPVQFMNQVCLPTLTLSHCGRRGMTKDCIEQVQKLHQNNRDFAKSVDQKMRNSVEQFKKLLMEVSDLSIWSQTMDQAHSCFRDWNLVPPEAEAHIQDLKNLGALACKMTGSGGGGFILSLWENTSFYQSRSDLIPITQGQ